MAKDFIILSGKEQFTYSEVEGYFKDRVFLNFLNELIIKQYEFFADTLIGPVGIDDAWFADPIPGHMRPVQENVSSKDIHPIVPFLNQAKRNQKWMLAPLDNIFT